jgi:hypothetical protein
LKNKLRNHNGLSFARKRKFIDEFLKAWGVSKNINGLPMRQPIEWHFCRPPRTSLIGCSPAEPISV